MSGFLLAAAWTVFGGYCAWDRKQTDPVLVMNRLCKASPGFEAFAMKEMARMVEEENKTS